MLYLNRSSKTVGILTAIIGLISVLPAYAMGTTYYVSSSDGHDSDDGLSQVNAFQTIDPVNSLSLQPGDTILFKCGDTWRGEMLTIEESGTAAHPITFGSYPTTNCANKPIFTGAETITGWIAQGGNIYRADLSAGGNAGKFPIGLNQLFQSDSRLPFGRWPNIGQTGFDNGYSNVDGYPTANQLQDNELPAGDWTGARIHLKGIRWYILNRRVDSDSGSTLTLNDNLNCYDGGCASNGGWGYWVSNHLATLDQNGEWFYDAATNRVYLYSNGGSPSNIEGSVIFDDSDTYLGGIILGRHLQQHISYVTIDNFEIKNWFSHGITTPTNWQNNDNDNIIIRNNHIKNVDSTGIKLTAWVWDNTGGVVTGWRGGHNLSIENNVIDGANHFGIDSYAYNSTFSDNEIKNIGLITNLNQSGMGCGITGANCTENGDGLRLKLDNATFSSHHNTVRYNRLEKIGAQGMDVFGHTNTIEYNVINQACYSKGDCGAVRTFGRTNLGASNVYDNILRSNIIIDTVGNTDGVNNTFKPLFGIGLYIDNYSRDTVVTGNTIISSTIDGVLFQNSTGSIQNNVLYNNNVGSMSRGQVGVYHSTSQVASLNNNVMYGLNYIDAFTFAKTLHMESATHSNLTASNNNYFFNPYRSDNISVGSFRTLAQWQSDTGFDTNSVESWFNLNPGDPPLSRVFYNDTKLPMIVNFNGVRYLTLDQTPMTSSMTLQPFTSVVLVEGARPLSTDKLTFADNNSPAQDVMLTNTGSLSLTITSISLDPTGDFTLSHNCPISPTSLATDADCLITVTFVATTPTTATLSIVHNGQGSPYRVGLVGGLLKTYLPIVLK